MRRRLLMMPLGFLCLLAIGLAGLHLLWPSSGYGRDMECKKQLKAGYIKLLAPDGTLVGGAGTATQPQQWQRILGSCPMCGKPYVYRPVAGPVSFANSSRPIAWCPDVCHERHRNVLMENGAITEAGDQVPE